MNNTLISVIVPVYNVERYLPRCIESILKQTYTNFELILVDDGTPDRSGIICDRYAEKDSRIRVIHKENGGVSTARNAGIDVAKGEWITFVDSDDWVSEKYLELLAECLDQNDYDLIVGAKENRGVHIISQGTDPKTIQTLQDNDIDDLKVFNTGDFMGPWMKLFSAEIIRKNNIKFIQGIAMAEDAIFVAEYLKFCKKIHLIGEVIYRYNILNNLSVSRRFPYFEDRKLWDLRYLKTYAEMLDAFKVDDKTKDVIMIRKATFGIRTVIRGITYNFDKDDSVGKITELFDYYSEWLNQDALCIDALEREDQKRLFEFIINRDSDAIYEMLKPQNRNAVKNKIKYIVKKMICPFIEKYRDGLKKYKF